MFASSTQLVKSLCVARVRRPDNPKTQAVGLRAGTHKMFVLNSKSPILCLVNVKGGCRLLSFASRGEGFLPNKLCSSFLIAKLGMSPQRRQKGEEEPGKGFRL